MWDRGEHTLFHEKADELHSSFGRLKNGGVKVQTMAIYVPHKVPVESRLSAGLHMVDIFYENILSQREDIVLIKGVEELNQLEHNEDKLYILLHIEGAEPLKGDLTQLRTFHRLGVRSLGFTWNYRNEAGDGVKERSPSGLSHFGLALLKEMNRLNMAVDISHLSEHGFWDCLDHTSQPIMASHCNARTLCDHPRNLYDEQIKAIFSQQGVIGINFVPYFLAKREQVDIKDILNHVEYMLSLGGENYIGFGSDFDGISQTVTGMEHSQKFSDLIEECLKHYSESIVQKLCFDNWKQYYMRLWKD